MAYIEYVPAPEGTPEPDNILRIHRVNPHALRAHYELYRVAMFHDSPLTRIQREMVAVVVSALNGCHY
jgi:alkylhydroperoxidase family enzyme